MIRDGAALVESAEDVIAALPARWRECVRPKPGAAPAATAVAPAGPVGDEDMVLQVVGEEPMTIDEVIEKSGLASGRAAALLLNLELQGRIRQLDGKRFVQAAATRA